MSSPLHPDQLGPDSMVGPWRIVASLGAGGFGRVFKVERGGRFFAMKVALRPAGRHAPEEEDVNGRLMHEVAALMACTPHPNLPRVHAMDRWPEPPDGYLYFVTDFVDGESFHEWRWRTKPTAAQLLGMFTEVVRVVADLHRRGVHHRDLKSDNVLIRREDEQPVLIDLGSVRMPGALTLTVGVAPASPHLLPPECVAFLREGTWQQGGHFDAGVPGDLYALGALLYESLTDGYAFDPKLPYDRLLPAIETVVPRPPQMVNPKVPPALGDIALRLMAKLPEERYASAEALLQALWEAAKEKRQSSWKVSLDLPAETDSTSAIPKLPLRLPQMSEQARGPPEVVAPPSEVMVSELSPASERAEGGASEPAVVAANSDVVPATPERKSPRRALLGVAGLLLLGLAAFGLSRLSPPSPAIPIKGTSPMTNASSGPPDAGLRVAALPVDSGMPPDVDAGTAALAVAMPPPSSPQRTAEATPTKKRTQGSSGVAKAAVTAAACIGLACATTGSAIPAQSPEGECPEGYRDTFKKMGIGVGMIMGEHTTWILPIKGPRYLVPPPRTDGLTTLVARIPASAPPVGDLMGDAVYIEKETQVTVQFFRGRDRWYGWATEIIFPDGSHHPFCANVTDYVLVREGVIGAPMLDTRGRPFVPAGEEDMARVRFSNLFPLVTTDRLGRLPRMVPTRVKVAK